MIKNSVTKIILAAVLASTSTSFAQSVDVAGALAIQSQKASEAMIAKHYSSMVERQNQIIGLAADFSQARKIKGGVQIAYKGSVVTNYVAGAVVIPTFFLKAVLNLMPETSAARGLSPGVTKNLKFFGAILAASVLITTAGDVVINISDSEMMKIEKQVQAAKQAVANDQAIIMAQASKLGANVNHNSMTISGLPEGLTTLMNGAGGVVSLPQTK
ncbi:MAG: hypothetical protein ACK5V3_11365 [Bdellovibrionales bacterium]